MSLVRFRRRGVVTTLSEGVWSDVEAFRETMRRRHKRGLITIPMGLAFPSDGVEIWLESEKKGGTMKKASICIDFENQMIEAVGFQVHCYHFPIVVDSKGIRWVKGLCNQKEEFRRYLLSLINDSIRTNDATRLICSDGSKRDLFENGKPTALYFALALADHDLAAFVEAHQNR